jgi:predicted hydrocarbon binding protein
MTVAGNASSLFFTWENLGDLEIGRPHLGDWAPVLIYRLMQYAVKAVLSDKVGVQETKEIFFNAGRLAGEAFCQNVLDTSLPLDRFFLDLTQKLAEWKIGILAIEDIQPDTLEMTLTVAEDLDCSGLPICHQTLCDYDEGFLAGILSAYTGKEFAVEEISCWATGDRVCRFRISKKNS